MDNRNDNKMFAMENPIFTFDPSVDRRQLSFVRVNGVGNCGCGIVNEMFRVDRYNIPGVSVLLLNNDAKLLEGKTVEEKRHVEVSAIEAKDIVDRNACLLFLVADLNENYSVRMVAELCQQFHKDDCEDDISGKVSVVLPVTPLGFEKEDGRVADGIAVISKVVTKVITINNVFTCKQSSSIPSSIPMNQFIGLVAKQVSDIIGTACRIFLEYDCVCVDYNDVAMVLQCGSKAIYGVGTGEGADKAEKAVAELKKNLELNGCKIENAKGVLLLIRYPRSCPPLGRECYDAIESLRGLLPHNGSMLWNASEDIYDESDAIAFHAIVLY